MLWSTLALQPSAVQVALLFLSVVVTVDSIRWFIHSRVVRRGHPLPPGPFPLPLLGSALSVDVQKPWLTYTAWRVKYGNVMYVRLLDSDVIVLNSYADAMELLERRSRIYSDRPFLATLEPYGHGGDMAFARYGPHWRLCRRIIHQTFHAKAALAFRPMQLHRARQIIINIIDDPKEYPFYYSTFSAAVAMSAVYDYEPQLRDDPMITIIDNFCEASLATLTPEMAALLKAFPLLLSVPEWVPGLSRIRRDAKKAYDLGTKATDMPFQQVQKRMEAKEAIVANTLVFNHLQRMDKLDASYRAEYGKALKHASFTLFLASAETTSSTMMSFTLAMVKNPRIWKRAQAEIDAVIGTDRLPEYKDRPFLPYVGAIVRETFRWKPVAPMGLPHAVISDDIYQGYYIPNGAIVFANIWAMTHDETRYPDPDVFIPERFLSPTGTLNDDNPADIIFGFGRRKCPGRHTADASIWISIATMLATLDFNAMKDENGNDVQFEPKFTTGLALRPVTFPCNLAPRAHITREALQRALAK